jgi:hypothetical protein
LRAGVEGVGFRRDVALEKRIGLAVKFNGFAAVQRGAGDELVAGLLVQEHHFAVFGVYAFFHDLILFADERVASRRK